MKLNACEILQHIDKESLGGLIDDKPRYFEIKSLLNSQELSDKFLESYDKVTITLTKYLRFLVYDL